jgi:hypothetical protein
MPWRHTEEWSYTSTILDLGTRYVWVVSFTPRTLSPRGSRSRHTLDRRLGGPQSRSGRCREKKNLDPTGIWTLAVQAVARCHTSLAILTTRDGRRKRNSYLCNEATEPCKFALCSRPGFCVSLRVDTISGRFPVGADSMSALSSVSRRHRSTDALCHAMTYLGTRPHLQYTPTREWTLT